MADEKDFEWALAFVLKAEGGYADVPGDAGGATNMGVTQATYNVWRRRQTPPQPARPVRDLTRDEAREIYRARYWETCGAPALPRRLALVVFDCAVNSGPSRAKSLLESARHETDSVGGHDRALDLVTDEEEVCLNYLDDREDFYQGLADRHPTQQKFLRGWLNRLEGLARYAQLDWSL